MAPTRQQQAAQNGAPCCSVKTEFRIAKNTKNTTTNKAQKKKSSSILFRALKKTAEAYGLDLTNAIRLWSSIGSQSPSHLYDADDESSDENTLSDDLSWTKYREKVEDVERYTTEVGDGEWAMEPPEAETLEAGKKCTDNVNAIQPALSDEELDAERKEGMSAPSRGHNECYHGGPKNGSFIGGGDQVPDGLSWKTVVGNEGFGSGGGRRDGDNEGGKAGDKEVASISEAITMEIQPLMGFKDGFYPCAWPDCHAPLKVFATKSAWRSHETMHVRPFRGHFQGCRSLAGASVKNESNWKVGGEQVRVNDLKGSDLRRYVDAKSLESHLKLFHSSQGNSELEDEETEVSALSASWRKTGNAPSREANEMYNGDAKDGLFSGEKASVPRGLSDRAAAGDGGDEEDDKMGGAGDGDEDNERDRDGDDNGDGGDDGDDPTGDWAKSVSHERKRISNRIAQRQYRRKLKHRLEELERRARDAGADTLQMHAKGGREQEIVDEQLIKDFGQQKAQLASPWFPSQELDTKNKGMPPSERDREKYYGGDSKDALFYGKVLNVPRSLIINAAGGRDGDEDDDDKEMISDGGDRDSGGADVRENSSGGTASTKTKHPVVVDPQRFMYPKTSGLTEEGVDKAHHGLEEASLNNCARKRYWKQKGITPSRGVNECYDGNSKDRLFTGGGARVPNGLSGRAGNDRGNVDEEMGASGNGGDGDDGNDDGGDDGDGFEEAQNSAKPNLNALEEYQRQLMLLEQENKKTVKQQWEQIEDALQECGCEECAIWEQQLYRDSNLAKIQRWFEDHLARQGHIISPPNADDSSAVNSTISEWLLKRQRQQRGSAPSRGMNECYNGGAEDGLFAGGGAQIPQGLVNKAAGRDREGSDLPTGGRGGGDDGDDGNGNNGSGARLDEEDHFQTHPLQDYQKQMMLLEQLNHSTWMAKHGRGHQFQERNSGDDGDYEMEDAWEREEALISVGTGEDGSSLQFQHELGDELTANPWI